MEAADVVPQTVIAFEGFDVSVPMDRKVALGIPRPSEDGGISIPVRLLWLKDQPYAEARGPRRHARALVDVLLPLFLSGYDLDHVDEALEHVDGPRTDKDGVPVADGGVDYRKHQAGG